MKENLQKQSISEIDNIDGSEEKGVALILTLSILVVLIMLAMVFVTMSSTNKKLASVHMEATQTRLLAESAIERIIGSIQLYNDNIDSGRIYPGTNSFYFIKNANLNAGSTDTGWDNRNVIFSFQSGGDTDWIHNFKTQFSHIDGTTMRDYLGWYGSDSAAFKSALPTTWKYIITNDGTTDRIIGRISYIIIDESGKIDPNRVTASGVDEAVVLESRVGSDVEEINLRGAGVSQASARALGYDNAGGKRPSNSKWFSWSHIIGGDTGFTQNEVDQYTGSLFPFSYDIEACWIDTDGNAKYDSGEDFHRFNLARNDWNSLTISDIVNDPDSFSLSDKTHDGDGIKWINDFSEAGDFGSLDARKNQIAANLIDYCDSDSIPETDGGDSPTYCGLEQTAYVNELHIKIDSEKVEKNYNNATGDYDYKWDDITIYFTPELVNVYNFAVGVASLEVDYTISATVNKGEAVPFKIPDVSGKLTYDFASGAEGRTYVTAPSQQVTIASGAYSNTNDMNQNLNITKIEIKCYLKDSDDNLIDYSTIDTGSAVNLDIHPSDKYCNYQTDDSRHNHFATNWDSKSGNTDQGTLGIINSVCKPGTSGDEEPGGNPWVSTCYIRNGVMLSPWELGVIHRGAAWETINLKAFKSGATGGGDYSDGDANILDQVKMNANTANSGKININTPVKDVLKALVRNIHVGQSYALPGATSSNQPISDSDSFLEDITNAILKNNGSELNDKGNHSSPFTNRAAVVNTTVELEDKTTKKILCDSYFFAQTTDAKKEEIIGKFINLTTVRQNLFTLIILAQTIKDAGSPSGSGVEAALFADLDQDGDTEGSVSESTAGWDIDGKDSNDNGNPDDDPDISDTDLDADGNPETVMAKMGRYDQYVDQITSDKKILVVVYRDAYTNKCKVLHFEYLED